MRRFAELPDHYLRVSHWAPHPCGGYYEVDVVYHGPGGPFYAIPERYFKTHEEVYAQS